MARKLLGMLLGGLVGILLTATGAHADEEALKKALTQLNVLTGTEPMRGALKALTEDTEQAAKMIRLALSLAKKKELSYNAALVLALAAAEAKDLKSAEVFFRVCMGLAMQLQSSAKLTQAYELPIVLYFEEKKYADCARLCKEAFELNPNRENPPIVIATMENQNGEVEFREPQEGFDTARRMKADILGYYVKATAKLGKYDLALKIIDEDLKGKNNWLVLEYKAWVLREAGKLEDAANVYENVIKQALKDQRFDQEEKEPYIERFHYEVSNVYIDLKKIDRATEHLEYLLKKRPNDPMFYNDLGYVWADNDVKLEEAEKLIRKALELDRERRKKSSKFDPNDDRDNGAYLDSLGWVLYKQKNYKEAKQWLTKAVADKSSQHIEIYDHLGDVLTALGEREAAIEAFNRGLEVSSEARRDQERKAIVEKKLEKLKSGK